MSRLADILDNHQNLDHFFSIIKHYGVSAEYLSLALIRQFESESEGNEDDEEGNSGYSQELVDDLKQFCARF
ncbi:hypothetical protein [Paenibacillus harenae]|uniref:hypothetical protein n=1 Tax=Paenibacillus harenae TaxID=306543 RepID=UPI0004058B54|nr:hypothetical protein [Paenibacillus harenae]